jgi:uncharacterized protein (TIGR03492 family)
VKRVLFVANGHGETAIAARIAEELQRAANGPLALDLFPIVGIGTGAAPLTLVGPRTTMPSGGLVAMGNVRAFARDVLAGFVALFARQVSFLWSMRGRYDTVLAVGDIYALALAFLVRAPTAFVGTAKSVYVAPYGPFERMVMRRARLAFVRDEPTAQLLRAQGVAAQAPGNVIADLVREPEGGAEPLPASIGIFPGSRAEAYEDGVRLARVVRELALVRPPVSAIFSIAPTLDAACFAQALAGDGWTIAPGSGDRPFTAAAPGAQLIAWSGPLGELLRASTAVLGQAGTANEQAAAFGVPVVALAGAADREDWYRMRQRRLLGEALVIVPSDPRRAAQALDALLRDDAALERMRLAGPRRLGGTGGAAAVARAVLDLA